jgi:hypothetical protein
VLKTEYLDQRDVPSNTTSWRHIISTEHLFRGISFEKIAGRGYEQASTFAVQLQLENQQEDECNIMFETQITCSAVRCWMLISKCDGSDSS